MGAAAFLLGVLLGTPRAEAHPLLQNHLWVVFAPDVVRVRVGVTPREVATVARLEPDFGGRFDPSALEEGLAGYGEYLRRHLRLTVEERRLDCRVTRAVPRNIVRAGSPPPTDLVFAQVDMECPTGWSGGPPQVAFAHDVLGGYSYAPGQDWDVSYVLRVKYVDDPEIVSYALRNDRPLVLPTRWSGGTPLPRPGPAALLVDHLHSGVRHILGGWDHLLFVGALVLGAASAWSLVRVVAAFTLAHSLTLALSVTGLVRLDPGVVEPVIAASIVAAALQNVLAPAAAERWRLAVAFGFGLFHGLGFAGGLVDAMRGLPASEFGLSILGFSAGVEIGHAIVVVPLVAFLRFGAHVAPPGFDRLALRWGSVAISLFGLHYLGVTLVPANAPLEVVLR
jgi:hydrogenase/urease accessory protein HupE